MQPSRKAVLLPPALHPERDLHRGVRGARLSGELIKQPRAKANSANCFREPRHVHPMCPNLPSLQRGQTHGPHHTCWTLDG